MIKFCSVVATLLIALVAAISSGCVAIVQTPEFSEQDIAAKFKDMSLIQAVKFVEARFRKAKEENLPLYSPTQYDRAHKGMRFARALASDKERHSDVMRSLYVADDALTKGAVNMAIVKRELPELLRLRASLDVKEAYKIFELDYRGLISSMTQLILEIEANQEKIFNDPAKKQDFDKRKQELITKTAKFEVRVVMAKHMSYANQLMAEAEQYDPKENTPKVFQSTMKARNDAIAYIEKNVDDEQGIAAIAESFQSSAYRLLHFSREVQKLSQLDKAGYEDYVLENEARFTRINDGLEYDGVTDKSFDEKAAILANVGSKLVKRLELANETEGPNLDKVTAELQKVQEQARQRENALLEQMEQLHAEYAQKSSSTVPYEQKIMLLEQQLRDMAMQKQSLERKLAIQRNETAQPESSNTDQTSKPSPENDNLKTDMPETKNQNSASQKTAPSQSLPKQSSPSQTAPMKTTPSAKKSSQKNSTDAANTAPATKSVTQPAATTKPKATPEQTPATPTEPQPVKQPSKQTPVAPAKQPKTTEGASLNQTASDQKNSGESKNTQTKEAAASKPVKQRKPENEKPNAQVQADKKPQVDSQKQPEVDSNESTDDEKAPLTTPEVAPEESPTE